MLSESTLNALTTALDLLASAHKCRYEWNRVEYLDRAQDVLQDVLKDVPDEHPCRVLIVDKLKQISRYARGGTLTYDVRVWLSYTDKEIIISGGAAEYFIREARKLSPVGELGKSLSDSLSDFEFAREALKLLPRDEHGNSIDDDSDIIVLAPQCAGFRVSADKAEQLNQLLAVSQILQSLEFAKFTKFA